MKSYLVVWKIDMDARSPREAAEKAMECWYPGTAATCFDVLDKDGNDTHVDLAYDESEDVYDEQT